MELKMKPKIEPLKILGMDGKPLNEEQAVENAPIPFSDFDLYQKMASVSLQESPKENRMNECLLGMAEEIGEFIGIHKRLQRGDYNTPELQKEAVFKAVREMGDTLYYMSGWCTEVGVPFGEIPFQNLEKIAKRMEQGNIKGTGSDREEIEEKDLEDGKIDTVENCTETETTTDEVLENNTDGSEPVLELPTTDDGADV